MGLNTDVGKTKFIIFSDEQHENDLLSTITSQKECFDSNVEPRQ